MKKTTFYTLVCTTFLVPSLTLAAEQRDDSNSLGNPLGTPARHAAVTRLTQGIGVDTPTREAESKKKAVEQKLPTTPQILEEKKQFYRENYYSPEEIERYAKQDAEVAKVDRERERKKAFREIDEEKTRELLRRRLVQEEKVREEEKVRQEELMKSVISRSAQSAQGIELLEKKVSSLQERLEEVIKEKEELGEALSSLEPQIQTLSAKIKEVESEKSLLEEQFQEDTAKLQQELERTSVSAEDSKAKLEALRSTYKERVAELDKVEDEKMHLLTQLELERIEKQTAILGRERLESFLRKQATSQEVQHRSPVQSPRRLSTQHSATPMQEEVEKIVEEAPQRDAEEEQGDQAPVPATVAPNPVGVNQDPPPARINLLDEDDSL